MIQVSGPGPYSQNGRRNGMMKMTREMCCHQRLAIDPYLLIVHSSLGMDECVLGTSMLKASVFSEFLPPHRPKADLEWDIGIKGEISEWMDWLCTDWVHGLGVWSWVGIHVNHYMMLHLSGT